MITTMAKKLEPQQELQRTAQRMRIEAARGRRRKYLDNDASLAEELVADRRRAAKVEGS
jgi:hypothetical protein